MRRTPLIRDDDKKTLYGIYDCMLPAFGIDLQFRPSVLDTGYP